MRRPLTLLTMITDDHLWQFECCGLTGPSEFARNADPIDMSCYTYSQADLSKEELASMNMTSSNEPVRVLHINKVPVLGERRCDINLFRRLSRTDAKKSSLTGSSSTKPYGYQLSVASSYSR